MVHSLPFIQWENTSVRSKMDFFKFSNFNTRMVRSCDVPTFRVNTVCFIPYVKFFIAPDKKGYPHIVFLFLQENLCWVYSLEVPHF